MEFARLHSCFHSSPGRTNQILSDLLTRGSSTILEGKVDPAIDSGCNLKLHH